MLWDHATPAVQGAICGVQPASTHSIQTNSKMLPSIHVSGGSQVQLCSTEAKAVSLECILSKSKLQVTLAQGPGHLHDRNQDHVLLFLLPAQTPVLGWEGWDRLLLPCRQCQQNTRVKKGPIRATCSSRGLGSGPDVLYQKLHHHFAPPCQETPAPLG